MPEVDTVKYSRDYVNKFLTAFKEAKTTILSNKHLEEHFPSMMFSVCDELPETYSPICVNTYYDNRVRIDYMYIANSRSVTYTTTNPYDEGWRTERGEFPEKSSVYIFDYAKDMTHKCLVDLLMNLLLKEIIKNNKSNMVHRMNDFFNEIKSHNKVSMSLDGLGFNAEIETIEESKTLAELKKMFE